LLAFLGYGLWLRSAGEPAGGQAVNWQGSAIKVRERPAALFTLRGFDGDFRLADQRGKLTLVNFWASWCAPCRDEVKVLQAAHQTYGPRGLAVVGVDVWDKEADARRLLREYGVTYPAGQDDSGTTAVEYGVRGLPESYFVSPDGMLVRRWIGPLTEPALAAIVAELLAP
jgi:cytochrome c biogenesis protein CcmG/thiol:disulfide interchange protein DsbE